MEKISNDYWENVRVLDGLLGVGRSCDMVSRDYLIGGRRARLWVVDGFGSDSILERMGALLADTEAGKRGGPHRNAGLSGSVYHLFRIQRHL